MAPRPQPALVDTSGQEIGVQERRQAEVAQEVDPGQMLSDVPPLSPEDWSAGAELLLALKSGEASYTKKSAQQLHGLALEGLRLYTMLTTVGQDVLARLADLADLSAECHELMGRLDLLPRVEEPDPDTDDEELTE